MRSLAGSLGSAPGVDTLRLRSGCAVAATPQEEPVRRREDDRRGEHGGFAGSDAAQQDQHDEQAHGAEQRAVGKRKWRRADAFSENKQRHGHCTVDHQACCSGENRVPAKITQGGEAKNGKRVCQDRDMRSAETRVDAREKRREIALHGESESNARRVQEICAEIAVSRNERAKSEYRCAPTAKKVA